MDLNSGEKRKITRNSTLEKEHSNRNHKNTIVRDTLELGENQFTCKICYENFALRSHLNKHMNGLVHLITEVHKRRTVEKHHLNKHILNIHENPKISDGSLH